MTTFSYKRGAPITIDLVVNDAGAYAPATLTARAKLKRALGNGTPPTPEAETLADLSIAFVAAAGQDPAYWRLTVPPGTIDGKGYGLFIVDVELSNGGTVIQVTDPILIDIDESVTP